MGDATKTRTLLLGIDGFRLLAATEHGHELVLGVETTAAREWCRTCGVRASSKGRARTLVRDVPMGDRPVVLVWNKRVDVVPDRTAAAVTAWFDTRGSDWCAAVEMAALDPYEGYATALRTALPDATIVVDHFHLIRLANQVVDEVRRRTQQQTTGHRGRKHDPLYRIRKLLLVAVERLDEAAHDRIRAGLDAGDPFYEVECAWYAKQLLRAVYAADDLDDATGRLQQFLDWADEIAVEEVSRLARTVRRWRTRILAYHHRRLSNGRTEAMILLVKRVKRIAFGFRNFRNYRVRLLLHCGVKWDTPPTARIRGPNPSLAA